MGTINGAYASFEENRKGSMTAGKLANQVVLGRDPLRVDPMSLIQVELIRRKRTAAANGEPDTPELNRAISATINGISAGLRNTG